jgi:hypothetical protein
MSESAQEVYARILQRKKHGYPLWIPEPSENHPRAYKQEGASIGDVGILAPDGKFDFLFNICRAAAHAINDNGVPDGFKPVTLKNKDIYKTNDIHPPESSIASASVTTKSFSASVDPDSNLFASFPSL